MSRGGHSSGRGRGNAGRSDGNNRWASSSSPPNSGSHIGDQSEDRAYDDAKSETAMVSTSFASWVIGVMTGGGENKAWFLKYVETEIFKQTCEHIKKKTGLDLCRLIAVIVSTISAGTLLPKMATSFLQFFKTQVTSSVTLSPNDNALQDGLLRFVRNSAVKPEESWLAFRGRHDERDSDGELKPVVGDVKQLFTFNDIIFILNKAQSDTDPGSYQDGFGHSNEPIVKLLEHVKKESLMSEKLSVHRIIVDEAGVDIGERDKRPLSSIDMEPKMMGQTQREVEDFLHKDFKKL